MSRPNHNREQVVAEFLAWYESEDPDHGVEMRWHKAYDGSTKWHTLFEEGGMARYGFFPWQADYRVKT